MLIASLRICPLALLVTAGVLAVSPGPSADTGDTPVIRVMLQDVTFHRDSCDVKATFKNTSHGTITVARAALEAQMMRILFWKRDSNEVYRLNTNFPPGIPGRPVMLNLEAGASIELTAWIPLQAQRFLRRTDDDSPEPLLESLPRGRYVVDGVFEFYLKCADGKTVAVTTPTWNKIWLTR